MPAGPTPQLQAAGVHLLVHPEAAARATEILSQPDAASAEAPGDLAQAEQAIRGPGGSGSRLRSSLWFEALVLLTLGGIGGFLLSQSEILESRHNVLFYADAVEVDQNGDGRIDGWHVYSGSEIARSRSDRNFDGEPDSWDFYRDGSIARSELDENFDGEVDAWLQYELGNLAVASLDLDHDGVADQTVDYEFGVPVAARLHPNGGPVEREEVYAPGPYGRCTRSTRTEVGRCCGRTTSWGGSRSVRDEARVQIHEGSGATICVGAPVNGIAIPCGIRPDAPGRSKDHPVFGPVVTAPSRSMRLRPARVNLGFSSSFQSVRSLPCRAGSRTSVPGRCVCTRLETRW